MNIPQLPNPFDKMFILEGNREYFPLGVSGTSDQNTKKILRKIGRILFTRLPGNWYFVANNFATPEDTYGVFP